MNPITFHNMDRKRATAWLTVMVAVVLIAVPAFGHGGKRHTEGDFTPLQAMEKAFKMYNQLIVTGKLGESWETRLVKVEISNRDSSGKKETVVSFHRAEETPEAVYFFFTSDGKYAGSNFTGK